MITESNKSVHFYWITDGKPGAMDAIIEALAKYGPLRDERDALRAERDAAIKRAEEAEAALATVQGEGVAAWRPIATAPKDGARVLLWYAPTRIDKGEAVEGFWDALFDGQWMTSRGASFIDGRLRQPTHWMPLPSGPVEGA
jgi:Protein of unknown function (DUF551)